MKVSILSKNKNVFKILFIIVFVYFVFLLFWCNQVGDKRAFQAGFILITISIVCISSYTLKKRVQYDKKTDEKIDKFKEENENWIIQVDTECIEKLNPYERRIAWKVLYFLKQAEEKKIDDSNI